MGRPRIYDPICSRPGCDRPHAQWGLCYSHASQVRYGRKVTDLDDSPEARFWRKVNKDAGGGCWEWMGARKTSGYGRFYLHPQPSQPVLAHRHSWEMANGRAIPDGLVICHHCDNPPCVNPAHLFLGTRADNNRDCQAKGRSNPGGRKTRRVTADR